MINITNTSKITKWIKGEEEEDEEEADYWPPEAKAEEMYGSVLAKPFLDYVRLQTDESRTEFSQAVAKQLTEGDAEAKAQAIGANLNAIELLTRPR